MFISNDKVSRSRIDAIAEEISERLMAHDREGYSRKDEVLRVISRRLNEWGAEIIVRGIIFPETKGGEE